MRQLSQRRFTDALTFMDLILVNLDAGLQPQYRLVDPISNLSGFPDSAKSWFSNSQNRGGVF